MYEYIYCIYVQNRYRFFLWTDLTKANNQKYIKVAQFSNIDIDYPSRERVNGKYFGL